MNPARSTDSCQTPVRNRTPPEHERAEAAEEGERAEVGQRHGAVADHRRLDDRVGVAERAHDQPGAGDDGHARRRRRSARWSSPSPSPRRWRRPGWPRRRRAGRRRAGRTCGPRGRGPRASRRTPNTSASTLKGRLTRKTQRQLAWTSSPPIGGPKAAAAPPTADHSPMAAPLRAGPKAGSSRPSEVGSMRAPPIACSTRAPTRKLERRGDGAEGGGGGEDGQAEQEGPLAPGPVGPAAGRHQGGGEDDGVGAEHPRQRAQALAVEGGRDAGEGDVDDEEVERGQEHARQHDQGGQDRPGGASRRCGGAPVSSVMKRTLREKVS